MTAFTLQWQIAIGATETVLPTKTKLYHLALYRKTLLNPVLVNEM